ncbi:VMAP-C domain-containing protein [Leptothoe sp. PORK10 BA2]|uniref:VMAP-C domain-containing protein n=1 Tax=Leptothoe sp. PORK10 BA2 TaxID=3110254 RepID=UPI002B221786|nr:trypsin-like peptidase domain-containing protein [Leptothoe sp. PORK10 BA2]MEA5464238.1 trypsin-like peptidase domain-containing protein [Leptothoe sp. PORK10 BA2]
MTAFNLDTALKPIIKIYRADSAQIVGTGFWLGGRYLLTCAHVVVKALNIRDHTESRNQIIQLVFDGADDSQKLSAKVINCQFTDNEGGQDTAVLQLLDPVRLDRLPVQPAINFQGYRDIIVEAYGYADGNAAGRNITATTRGTTTACPMTNWVQIEVSQTIGTTVRGGLSGSPVWYQQRCVGMIVARDDLQPEDRLAFMIPVEHLRPALRIIQRERLHDILHPVFFALQSSIETAYQLCRSKNALTLSQQGLANILDDLADMSSGAVQPSDEGQPPDKLVQFVAALLNRSEPRQLDGLEIHLTTWANHYTQNFNAIRIHMGDLALSESNKAIAPNHPVLLIRVQPDDDSDCLDVRAWLIPDPAKYDPFTSDDGAQILAVCDVITGSAVASEESESSPSQGVSSQDLPRLIATYLDQVGQVGINPADLTVELLLPFSLLDAPAERFPMLYEGLAEEMAEPLGIGSDYCSQVIVRSQDRLFQPRAIPRWKQKWAQVQANDQTPASQVLIGKTKTIRRDIKSPNVLGLKLTSSPDLTNAGDIALLIVSGTPLAVWVRKNQAQQNWEHLLETAILNTHLNEVPQRVLTQRRAAPEPINEADCTTSSELGYHLALLWDNPYHVPPDQYLTSESLS